jgi:hypothetical protein
MKSHHERRLLDNPCAVFRDDLPREPSQPRLAAARLRGRRVAFLPSLVLVGPFNSARPSAPEMTSNGAGWSGVAALKTGFNALSSRPSR